MKLGVSRRTIDDAHAWWREPSEIARLLRWLHYDCDGLDVKTAIDIVETPHHWDEEYSQMLLEKTDVDARMQREEIEVT